MKIIYHHRTQGEEPESVHITAIIGELRTRGHDVKLVGPTGVRRTTSSLRRPALTGRIKQAVPRFVFEFLQLGYNTVIFFRLWLAIKRFRPDLIYERYALFSFAGILAAKLAKIPIILEVNTPYAQAWGKYFGLHLRAIARWTESKTILAADHVITVTASQRVLLEKMGVATDRISVCHNAIDPSWFDPALHDRSLIRERLGLTGVVIGFVGTMNRWQGMLEFPEVIRKVLAGSNNASFLLVGDGEFRLRLEQYCVTHGIGNRAVFTGRRAHSEIPALIAAMDIAVLLNSNDYGSPMKLFEYMGMEKAIIAPSVSPVREVMRDGETGLLIAPGSITEMSEKILYLIRNPDIRRSLGSAGRAYVITNHTWRQNGDVIIDAYSKIMQCVFDKRETK